MRRKRIQRNRILQRLSLKRTMMKSLKSLNQQKMSLMSRTRQRKKNPLQQRKKNPTLQQRKKNPTLQQKKKRPRPLKRQRKSLRLMTTPRMMNKRLLR